MADTKISALSPLTGVEVADGDEVLIVDKSDTAMAASGTNKRITFAELNVATLRRDLGLDVWNVIGGFLP